MYTVEQITRFFQFNNFRETQIVCPDGVEITITPCRMGPDPTSLEEVEYFLVHGDMPWMGADTIEKLTKEINNHAENLKALEDERKELRAFFDKHQANDDWDDETWSWYSDWHKDLYGYRPHGKVCGVYVRPY